MTQKKKNGVRSVLIEEFYTYVAFWIVLSALPALAISYVVVKISKHLWLKLLSSRYPGLDFVGTDTVRSLLDTNRNQGIINVLICVKGVINPDQIKHQLTERVIDKRDKNGDIMFPRLRQVLMSCWGNYAWEKKMLFKSENHLIFSNGIYRGRPVTENNIQEYVSDIVSKYFPSDQPPWQYIVIPCVSNEPKFYTLIRVHHLLLTGKKSLNIGDLLLIEQLKGANRMIPPSDYVQESPLSKLFPNPSAIPELWSKISENLSNAWNEFISEYDPVESPRAHKTLPGIFHVAGMILISSTTALRDLAKRRSNDSYDTPVTVTTFFAAIKRECKRRNLTVPKVLISPLITADPRKWPKRIFGIACATTKTIFKLPMGLHDEFMAIKELKNSGQVSYTNTFTWKYGGLVQLWGRAMSEAWHVLVETYRAPAKVWTDALAVSDGKRHMLQTVSLCGRKNASWSRPVSRTSIERAARAMGVSSTDIALYGATESLRAFFEQGQQWSPDLVLTTARAATEDFLYTSAEGDGKSLKKSQTGGMVCLSLPVGASPRRIASVVDQACSRQGALAGAWAAQAQCGALTRTVPSPLARLILNVLSRKYAVSYAEINSPVDARPKWTVWGQIVESVVYWRPPQANISMSLTVIQYADTVRLAVMTDARLSPGHNLPANRWPSAIEQLVTKVDQEIARISSQTQSLTTIPQIIGPEEIEDIDDSESSQALPSEQSMQTLKPPRTEAVSPPPMRRNVTY